MPKTSSVVNLDSQHRRRTRAQTDGGAALRTVSRRLATGLSAGRQPEYGWKASQYMLSFLTIATFAQ